MILPFTFWSKPELWPDSPTKKDSLSVRSWQSMRTTLPSLVTVDFALADCEPRVQTAIMAVAIWSLNLEAGLIAFTSTRNTAEFMPNALNFKSRKWSPVSRTYTPDRVQKI